MLLARPPAGPRLVPVPKPYGIRWLTILDEASAASYRAAVAPLVPAIERALRPRVIANRVTRACADPPLVRLEPWRPARARFRREARRLAGSARALLLADVRGCYASIDPEVVEKRLWFLGCSRDGVASLTAILRGFASAGVPGLPIGPEPSAVLANAVLASGDDALAAAGLEHLRWVDDFWVFASGRREAESALGVLRAALAKVGLEPHDRKTRIADGVDEVAAAVTSGAVSATGPVYDRPADAHAVPGVPGSHPRAPTTG